MSDAKIHQPVIAPSRNKGDWLVFCDACSADQGDYVYPCRKTGSGDWQTIPAILHDPRYLP